MNDMKAPYSEATTSQSPPGGKTHKFLPLNDIKKDEDQTENVHIK